MCDTFNAKVKRVGIPRNIDKSSFFRSFLCHVLDMLSDKERVRQYTLGAECSESKNWIEADRTFLSSSLSALLLDPRSSSLRSNRGSTNVRITDRGFFPWCTITMHSFLSLPPFSTSLFHCQPSFFPPSAESSLFHPLFPKDINAWHALNVHLVE